MDPSVARRMWRSCEPFHGLVYFVPEARVAYGEVGLEGRSMGYMASRSAPMGPVGAGVVTAAFFNFHPDLVAAALPEAWRRADPEHVIAARFAAVDESLRRMLGEELGSDEMAEAAALAREAAEACPPAGRPVFAAHAGLVWPRVPHLALWHALTLLREFRGDGHVAALVTEGLTGCEALVVHAATGEVGAAVLRASRSWSEAEWAAAEASLRSSGHLDADGVLTDAGRDSRRRVEDVTDAVAMAPWRALGPERSDRLRELVRPWSRAVVQDGTFSPQNLFVDGAGERAERKG